MRSLEKAPYGWCEWAYARHLSQRAAHVRAALRLQKNEEVRGGQPSEAEDANAPMQKSKYKNGVIEKYPPLSSGYFGGF